jgi:hypothetical protein
MVFTSYLKENITKSINEVYDNILYFRIKNSSGEIVIAIAKFILDKLYGVIRKKIPWNICLFSVIKPNGWSKPLT